MKTIFEAAKDILSSKIEYSPKQLKDMTTVLLSLGSSYDDINTIRTALKKNGPAEKALIKLCALIMDKPGAFNTVLHEAAGNSTNGISWDLESETKRRNGDFHIVFDKRIKKIIAFGLTKASSKEIVSTDNKNLKAMHTDDYITNSEYVSRRS